MENGTLALRGENVTFSIIFSKISKSLLTFNFFHFYLEIENDDCNDLKLTLEERVKQLDITYGRWLHIAGRKIIYIYFFCIKELPALNTIYPFRGLFKEVSTVVMFCDIEGV